MSTSCRRCCWRWWRCWWWRWWRKSVSLFPALRRAHPYPTESKDKPSYKVQFLQMNKDVEYGAVPANTNLPNEPLLLSSLDSFCRILFRGESAQRLCAITQEIEKGCFVTFWKKKPGTLFLTTKKTDQYSVAKFSPVSQDARTYGSTINSSLTWLKSLFELPPRYTGRYRYPGEERFLSIFFVFSRVFLLRFLSPTLEGANVRRKIGPISVS